MKQLFNHIETLSKPIGNLVHIGAGQCSELSTYLRLSPQKIILIEPDEQQAEHLKSITQDNNNIDILTCAIADTEAQKTLYVLSNPRDNSLLKPKEILTHYPSLQIKQEQLLTTQTLTDVLQAYTFDDSYQHILILELQGLEYSVIQSTARDVIQQFNGIILRASTEKLYQHEQQENTIALLESISFDHTHQEDEKYSTLFTRLFFQRNDDKIALALAVESQDQLQKIMTDQKSDIEKANKVNNEQLKEIEVLTANIESQGQLQKVIADQKSDIEKASKVNNEQLEISIKQLKEIEELTKTIELQNDIEKSNKTKEEKTKTDIEQLNKTIKEQKEKLKTRADTEEKHQRELEQARETASLSVKLQILKEADLKDLQQRYKKSILAQESQHKLLNKLTDRLSIAADYYHQLPQESEQEQGTQLESNKKKTNRKQWFRLPFQK